MKRRKKWRPGGRPRPREQGSRSNRKQMLKTVARSMVPGKGELDHDADIGVCTAGTGEHRRPAA